MKEHIPSPEDQMAQWITSKWITQPMSVIAELGIADLLRNEAMSIDFLAKKTDTHAPTLYRLLRALSSVGIFEEKQDRVFAMTPLAKCLLSDHMGPMARMFLSAWHDKAWSSLAHTVRTGEPGFDHAHGEPVFSWMEDNPEAREVLDQGQGVKALGFAKAVSEACDFSGITSVCDIGGGQGVFLRCLLSDHPRLMGTVAEMPGTARTAADAIARTDLKTRCNAIPYDFLKEIPPVCDGYFLVNILHDWQDDICHRLLKNISRAMVANAKLWVVEYLLEPTPGFSVAKLLDIEVLVMGGGRERSLDEYKELLGSAGLTVSMVTPTNKGPAVLECMLAYDTAPTT